MTGGVSKVSLFIVGSVLCSSQAFTSNGQSCHLQSRSNFSALSATKLSDEASTSRRSLLQNALSSASTMCVAANVLTAQTAAALDFDAFESSQISSDSKSANPELSEDAALCKYGAPGRAMGEACERAKMKPRLPSDVNANGKADRGDYIKCVDQWNIVNDKYVKTRECKPIREWGPEVK